MALEKHLSLRAAARMVGISPHTLKKWLRKHSGILLPCVERGSRMMLRERDVQRVVEIHRDARTAT